MHTSVLQTKPENKQLTQRTGFTSLAVTLLMAAGMLHASIATGAEVDEDAAVALAKKSQCFKCHSVDKRKKAPSYKEVAAKYQGNSGAERLLFLHITGNPDIKLDDEADRHTSPETKDEKEIYNLVHWILSR